MPLNVQSDYLKVEKAGIKFSWLLPQGELQSTVNFWQSVSIFIGLNIFAVFNSSAL